MGFFSNKKLSEGNKFNRDSVIFQRILRILGILSIISAIILMAISSYDLQELMLIDQLEANIWLAEIEENILSNNSNENDENIWLIENERSNLSVGNDSENIWRIE